MSSDDKPASKVGACESLRVHIVSVTSVDECSLWLCVSVLVTNLVLFHRVLRPKILRAVSA
jgi:hypothetical protein